MNENIFKHIEYLLPDYNCVVVPDFGSFIANIEPAKLGLDGYLSPPKYEIIFNPDLKHDDGVLISSIHKDANIPYNVAQSRTKSAVKKIKLTLNQVGLLECGNIGTIHLDENKTLTFKSSKTINHPAFCGLQRIQLKNLSEVNQLITYQSKSSSMPKYIYGGIAAAVAALLLLVLPATEIDNSSQTTEFQRAGFLESLTSDNKTIERHTVVAADLSVAKNEAAIATIPKTDEPTILNTDHQNSHYIIVAGENSKSKANKLLEKIKKSNFPQASIVESSDRYRIYVASFDDKAKAEKYLADFIEKHPSYEDAWVYTEKSK